MHLPLPLRLAIRQLTSRNSHTAVTAISLGGTLGIAVATMAMLCVLAVFNGFRDTILSRDSKIISDILILPKAGHLIDNADSLAGVVSSISQVKQVTPLLTEDAVAFSQGSQYPILLQGVDMVAYQEITDLDNLLTNRMEETETIGDETSDISVSNTEGIESNASEDFDESALFSTTEITDVNLGTVPIQKAYISYGVSKNLNLSVGQGIEIFVPRRTATITLHNPAGAFMIDSLKVEGVFTSGQAQADAATVITDLATVRRLLEYDHEATSIMVAINPGTDLLSLKKEILQELGTDFQIQDRNLQQRDTFNMINVEKWITFLLLAFIFILAAFNIVTTMSMLVIEKKRNIHTMFFLGADKRLIGDIYFWESVIITIAGTFLGLLLGTVLCEAQSTWGFIKLNADSDNFILRNYPVAMSISDTILICILSLSVAVIIGITSAAYARSKVKNS